MKWENGITFQLCLVVLLLAAILWVLSDIKQSLGG